MMNSQNGVLNLLQVACAVLCLLAFLLLPIVSFGMFGLVIFSLNGLALLKLSMTIYVILLIGCLLMIGFSFGAMQNYSIFVAGLMLVAEIVLMATATSIMRGADVAKLIAFLPQEYASTANSVLSTVINTGLKTGLGMYLMLAFTVLYGVFQFVHLDLLNHGSRPTAAYSGTSLGDTPKSSPSGHTQL